MYIVVVFYISSVASVDFTQKASQFCNVKLRQSLLQSHLLHDIDCDGLHSNFTTNFGHESMNVEAEIVN